MKKNIFYIVLALIIVAIMVCIIAFVIPKVENKPSDINKTTVIQNEATDRNGTTVSGSYSNNFNVKMPSNDEECAILEAKIKAYESGDKSVFSNENDYSRALGYVRDYKSFIEDGV